MSEDINELLEQICNKQKLDEYIKAQELLKTLKPFTYTKTDDMSKCIESFLDRWFDYFNVDEFNHENLVVKIAEYSNKNVNDIILDYDFMCVVYRVYLSTFLLSVMTEKSILNKQIEHTLRKGLLTKTDSYE